MIPESCYSPDAPFVKLYSVEHIIYLLTCFAIIFIFIKAGKTVKKKRDAISKIFLGVLAFQQIFLLYGWYICCSGAFLSQGLPLHLCRVSSLLTLVFLITKDKRIMDVIFYFSIYALISFFYPMNVYNFAHVSGVSYMINHLVTVLIPIFGAIAYDWCPGWKSFARAAAAFTVYLPVAVLANHLTGGNYFYLVDRPFLGSLPAWLYTSLAYVVTVGAFALVTLLVTSLVKRFGRKAEA